MEPDKGKQTAIKSRFLPRVSAVQRAFTVVAQRALALFFRPSERHHTTPHKILKGLIGFLPVAFGAYSLGVYLSNQVDYSQFVHSLESEDQIYSFLDQGHPVMAFHFVTGELLCEVMTPVFSQAAYHYGQ